MNVVLTGRLFACGGVAALLFAGCGGNAAVGGGELQAPIQIDACAAVDGMPAPGTSLAFMMGRYRIAMVREAPEADRRVALGTLVLERLPAELDRFQDARTPLAGTVDIDLASVGAQTFPGLDSQDPERPGVLVLESETEAGVNIVLRLGAENNRRDRQSFDGAYTALQVHRIQGDNFAGSWRSGLQESRVEGHFCAVRSGE